MSIKGACKGRDLSTNSWAVNDLIQSNEVTDYLPYIFPIAEPERLEDMIEPLKLKHIRKPESLIKRKPLFKINEGRSLEEEWLSSPSCDDTPIFIDDPGNEYSEGIKFMIRQLNRANIRNKKHNRVVIILSKGFMDYHNISSTVTGFVWAYKGRRWQRNILFVNESYNNSGTLLHEMAHSIGQLKEFYEEYYDKAKTQPVLCQRFNGSPEVFCDKYFIKRGIKSKLRGAFEWQEDKRSIMYGANIPVFKKWIDRETYQKAFRFLKRYSLKISTETQEEYKNYHKLIVSGSYNKESNEWTSLEREILTPEELEEVSSKLTDGLSDEGKMNYIKIQLINNNEIVYEVRHPSDMYAEIYYEEGQNEKIPLPMSLIDVVLPIIGEGDFKIRFFKGAFWFNEEGEVIERIGEEEMPGEMNFQWFE